MPNALNLNTQIFDKYPSVFLNNSKVDTLSLRSHRSMWAKWLGISAVISALFVAVGSINNIFILLCSLALTVVGVFSLSLNISYEVDLYRRDAYLSFRLFKWHFKGDVKKFEQLSWLVSPYPHLSFVYQLQIDKQSYPIGSLVETKSLALHLSDLTGIHGIGKAKSGGETIGLQDLQDVVEDRTVPPKLWHALELSRLTYPFFISLFVVYLVRLI